MIAVAVRFPAEHCVVTAAAVLFHHEKQARRSAIEQGRTVGRTTENVVRSIEYDRRLAVDSLAVKRRLLAGLRLAGVVPERSAVSPGADLAGLLRHRAAIQPETQAQRRVFPAFKHGSLDRFGYRKAALGVRHLGRDLIHTGLSFGPVQRVGGLTVGSDELIVFEKLDLGDGR